MTTPTASRWRIALDTKVLDDLAKGNLVASIDKLSKQSNLMSIPAIAACVAALVTKAATLKASNEAVDLDEKKLKTDVQARDASRTGLDTELVSLKALVGNHATSAADVTGMGFQLIDTTASRTKPDAPVAIAKPGKQPGKARAAVAGKIRGRFVAEMALDPAAGPWTSLPGNGKERKLSGFASGTKVAVRFAQVRYGLQSDWSVPVIVNIP